MPAVGAGYTELSRGGLLEKAEPRLGAIQPRDSALLKFTKLLCLYYLLYSAASAEISDSTALAISCLSLHHVLALSAPNLTTP